MVARRSRCARPSQSTGFSGDPRANSGMDAVVGQAAHAAFNRKQFFEILLEANEIKERSGRLPSRLASRRRCWPQHAHVPRAVLCGDAEDLFALPINRHGRHSKRLQRRTIFESCHVGGSVHPHGKARASNQQLTSGPKGEERVRSAREEPTWPVKLLILKKLKLAERVGFVPVVPAPINDLAPIRSPQSTKSTQSLSIRYKTGTVQRSALKAGSRSSNQITAASGLRRTPATPFG